MLFIIFNACLPLVFITGMFKPAITPKAFVRQPLFPLVYTTKISFLYARYMRCYVGYLFEI